MSCSLTATYKYVYDDGETVKYGKGTCVISDNVGLAPSQQEASLRTMLMAAFGGTGITPTLSNYKQDNLIVNSSGVYVEGLTPVADGIIVAEYMGSYTSYPKYTTVQIEGVSPGTGSAGITSAISDAITNSISSRWSSSIPAVTVADFTIKSISLYVHL